MQNRGTATDGSVPHAAPTATVLVERPPPGLARGSFAWPPWAIAVTGGAIGLTATLLFVWLLTRRLKRQSAAH